MTLAEKINYIRRNYGDIPVRLIAEDTGMSRSSVCRIVHRLGIHIPTEQLRELKFIKRGVNPNPVTRTTRLLICRYYSEGSSINHIAYVLCRPRDEVKSILDECIKNGFYDLAKSKHPLYAEFDVSSGF